MDAEDRRLFELSLRKATETLSGAALDDVLDDVGWRHALQDDPHVAVSTLFALLGETNAVSSALDDVVLAALTLDVPDNSAVVLPRISATGAPAVCGVNGLTVRGVATRRILSAETVVVVAGDNGTNVAVVLKPGDFELRPVRGIDPQSELVEVYADAAAISERYAVPWHAGLAAGQVALAHQLIGASTSMLRLARDHAMQRVQFGRAIASFQAVRHRLADSLIAIESARAAAAAAADAPSTVAAAFAKAIAGRSARAVAGHAQQVLGGVGFTAEHRLHRYVRRTLLLDQLLGSRERLARDIAQDIIRTRALPQMLPL